MTLDYYPTRPPEEWATGGEPMTERQRVALSNVAAHDHIDVPFLRLEDSNGQNVTKAEAWILIAQILDGVRPTLEHLNSLGRDPNPHNPPPHPQYWYNCNARPTEMQMAWLNRLVDRMGIPNAVKVSGLRGVTRGQASLLIGRLREQREYARPGEDKRMVFEDALQRVRDELPAPVQ
ncbi:hypothetical protein C8Q79DRAFT_454606 [Trametes meyenii]|nr:hypothetical protein C8Q79DRAFT_454606 [Trametes meyenii]